MEARLLYDRKTAALMLSISVRSIDYIIAAKGLDTRRIGRKVLVTHASLVRFARGHHPAPLASGGGSNLKTVPWESTQWEFSAHERK